MGGSEQELIRIAIRTMGLDELAPFKPEEKIIEYLLKDPADEKLARLSLSGFADETASESAAPGGGSVAAYLGALGASLGAMVANLSAHKKGWEDRWESFSDWAEKATACKKELLSLVDADTRAFQGIMQARSLPKNTESEKSLRTKTLREANILAIEIPFKLMQLSLKSMDILKAMATDGNPHSISDAGVGALSARSAVLGAYLNVCINAKGSESDPAIATIVADGKIMKEKAIEKECEILDLVGLKMNV